MEWLVNIMPILFIAGFAYGLIVQIKKSLFIVKSVSWHTTSNKRVIFGNHLYTLTLAGFVLSLIVNLLVFNQYIPQPHGTANTASLSAFVCLLGMFIAPLGIMPKEQDFKALSSSK